MFCVFVAKTHWLDWSESCNVGDVNGTSLLLKSDKFEVFLLSQEERKAVHWKFYI